MRCCQQDCLRLTGDNASAIAFHDLRPGLCRSVRGRDGGGGSILTETGFGDVDGIGGTKFMNFILQGLPRMYRSPILRHVSIVPILDGTNRESVEIADSARLEYETREFEKPIDGASGESNQVQKVCLDHIQVASGMGVRLWGGG
jgi:hypothetical protein